MSQWQPIETAPKGAKQHSVLLACANSYVPIYCGRYRIGSLGEPQHMLIEWRCDSSGRFANPTHWMPLPPPPDPQAEAKQHAARMAAAQGKRARKAAKRLKYRKQEGE